MSECTDWMTEVRWKLASVSAYGRRDVYEGLNVARSEAELRVKRDTVLTEHNSILLVAMRSGGTPVPISNTMVKT